MATQLNSNQAYTVTLPMTVTPSGLPCAVNVYLNPATGSTATASFTSTGVQQSIAVPFTTPSNTGTFDVYIDVYSNSVLIAKYISSDQVVISAPVSAPSQLPIQTAEQAAEQAAGVNPGTPDYASIAASVGKTMAYPDNPSVNVTTDGSVITVDGWGNVTISAGSDGIWYWNGTPYSSSQEVQDAEMNWAIAQGIGHVDSTGHWIFTG